MRKKLISILLTAALVVGLMPTAALALNSVDGVCIGGVELTPGQYYVNGATEAVTEEPDSWNAKLEGSADTGYTLTINNLSVRGDAEYHSGAAIYSGAKLTLVLEGANSLTGADITTGNSAGIYVNGDLTITGAGALSATGGAANSSHGIYGGGSVEITGGTVVATGGTTENQPSVGIYVKKGNIIISDGTVIVTGGTSSVNNSYGLYTVDGNITISGGTTVATGGAAKSNSYGVYVGGYQDYSLKVSDGILIARAGTSDGSFNVASNSNARKAIYNSHLWNDDGIELTNTKVAGMAYWGTDGTTFSSTGDSLSATTATSLVIVPSSWTETELPTVENYAVTLTGNTYIVNDNATALNLSNKRINSINTTDADNINYTLLAVSLYESAENYATQGIACNTGYGLTVNGGGEVIAVGGTTSSTSGAVSSAGINASDGGLINQGADIIAIGGTGPRSVGVYAASGAVNNASGTITGIGGTATAAYAENSPWLASSGIYASGFNGNGGTLTAIGGSGANSYGVYISDNQRDIQNKTNATLTAIAGSGTNSYGVYGGRSVINDADATLTAISGTAGVASVGVYGKAGVTNNGTLTATAGPASSGDSIGVYGGTLTNGDASNTAATGGTASGISAGVDISTSITGTGALTAAGGTATTSYGMRYTGAETGWLTSGEFQGSTAAISCTGDGVTLTSLLADGADGKVGYYDKDTKSVTGEDVLKTALYLKVLAEHIVSFDAKDHGIAPGSQAVLTGSKAEKPEDLTADNYTFGGWYTSTDGGTTLSTMPYDFDTPVIADLTLYAKWTQAHTVTFDYNGRGAPNSRQTVEHNGYAAEPSPAPTAEGYDFGGWYKEPGCENKVDFDTYKIEDDVTLYAKWTIKTYTVTFNANGHSDAPEQQTVEHGKFATEPATDPEATGYVFGGWYKEPDCKTAVDFETYAITNDVTLYALWRKVHNVTFDNQGHGTAPAAMSVPHGSSIDDPGDLTEDGYTFGGWYHEPSGENKVTFPYTIENDVTLYALWTEKADGPTGPVAPPSYPPTVTQPENGKLRIIPTYPQAGDEVTITVTPDEGYETTDVIVTDRNGGPVDVTDNGDGSYTFTQPAGPVTITAQITPVKAPCPQDETCPISQFTDADPTAWYHDGLHYCIEHGLMIGVSDTEFQPHGLTTRGTIVTILHRLEGKPEVTTSGTFTDVAHGLWYTEAVEWAAANGIVEGDGEKFYPETNLTREQMATILYRYAQYKGVDVAVGEENSILSFGDVDEVSDWAYPALQWACAVGLYEGDDNGLLRPGADLERCEMATLIYRLCENILK